MEGIQPPNQNVANVPRSRFKWNKIWLVASGIQGLGLILCLIYICLHFNTSQVESPPLQSIGVRLLGCEKERFSLLLNENENETMKVQNNSIVINCDGLYLISLKGSFFQSVSINIHYRNRSNPILVSSMDRRIDFTTVIHMGYKDEVYLKPKNTACEQLSFNGGQLFLIQLRSDRYCAQ
ncbi:tumor necrosis factor ligand superfamily member 4 [Perognathus longimembris pacificus]|uniref:tumor necrosis factor ligand superfamily member 4 n=1 Tax=Perognathus longimembris pacificus TaxID=214514 RepID=UPI0020195766|nr:tumor necrosis factor ligand superfamily member 4 [Perognathus longimembris pacificus]